MLNKKQKLNLSLPQDRKIFQEKKIKSKDFTLFFRDADRFRALVVVPKKCVPLAVDRNRIRRLIYNQIKNHKIVEEKKEVLVLYQSKDTAGSKLFLKKTLRELEETLSNLI
ncbi:MAG: hypothetical protein XD95_0055 [Microgenomates bacterium 39_7]|nr:MAG: hypothetical protein XD95_0055 [Microgenomates bacterium 39_7]